jgi:hypothetical protein
MDWKKISTGGHRSNRLIIHEFRQVCKIGYIKIAGVEKISRGSCGSKWLIIHEFRRVGEGSAFAMKKYKF